MNEWPPNKRPEEVNGALTARLKDINRLSKVREGRSKKEKKGRNENKNNQSTLETDGHIDFTIIAVM